MTPPDETTTTPTVDEAAAPATPEPASEGPEAAPEPKPDRKTEILEKFREREAAEGRTEEEEAAVEAPKEKPAAPDAPDGKKGGEVFFNEVAGTWQRGGKFITKEEARAAGADVDAVDPKAAKAEPAEGAPEAEGDPEAEGADEGAFVLEGVDGRGEKVSVDLPDNLSEQTKRTLRMFANDSVRYRTERAELEGDRREIDEFTRAFEADPVGVIMGRMNEEAKLEVAHAILTDDAIGPKIVDLVEEWSYDPDKREKSAAEIERDRYKRKLEMIEKREREARVRSALTAVDKRVAAVVDGAVIPAANAILENHIRITETIPHPDEIPGLLREHGLSVSDPAADPSNNPASPENPAAAPAKGAPADESAQVKGSSSPKRADLVTTPAGGSTPATRGLQVPEGIKLRGKPGETAKDYILGRVGLGRRG